MLYRNFATQDEIDAQYELERAVKDSRQYGEQFTRTSSFMGRIETIAIFVVSRRWGALVNVEDHSVADRF